ncbi:MAG TPA: SDR family NAD(P)-dependent oxidoreductase, partial [Chthoniobacterales bacterium]|nr:SDR family NAD(P)-dependent oxidoreductase [Chthoniobacterales bacterium]
MNLFDLSHRRILITGSNAGLGFAIARGLAQHGADVILNGRNSEKLRSAADLLRKEGHTVEEARFDITNEDEVRAAAADLSAKRPIDVLINNAGIQRRVRLDEISLATWNEVIQTNLTSA